MANPNFEVSTITTSGAAMLAQATEGNKVIFSGCEANSTVYTLEQAKAVSAITGTRITDGIEVTDVTDARILVRATFEPSATTGGEANSLILFGRLSSQNESTRTPICVVSNSAPFYLPTSDQAAVTAFDCLFTVQYNISSPVVIEQTSALECSLAEFRQLKERVVTTHKAGEEDSGDIQTIYGKKTFIDNLFAEENLTVYGDVIAGNLFPENRTSTLGSSDYEWNTICARRADVSGVIYVGTGIAPNSDAQAYLGISGRRWHLVISENLKVDTAEISAISGAVSAENISPAENISYSLGSADAYWLAVFADTLKARAADLSGDLNVEGNIVANYVYPTEQAINDIGSSTQEWSNIFTKKATVSSALSVTGATTLSSASFSGVVNANGGVVLNGASLTFNSGASATSQMKYHDSGIDVYGKLTPGNNNLYSLGSNNYKWLNVFAKSLSGSANAIADVLCPSTDTSSTVSIGSVILLSVRSYRASGATGTTVVRGTSLSSSSWDVRCAQLYTPADVRVTTATLAYIGGNVNTAASGTYRLLSDLFFPANSGSTSSFFTAVALAVRIA